MLRDLYDQLPKLQCRGLCHDSCTIIDVSELEREQLAERGVELPDTPAPVLLARARRTGNFPRCPALTSFNTCKAYDVRPFICRAFGIYAPPVRWNRC
jgi:Fe-S-cluster containining protein